GRGRGWGGERAGGGGGGGVGVRGGRRLPRRHQVPPQGAGQLADRASGRRREGFRRHRGGDGEAARRRRRPRLAGQAHELGLASIRLVAVPRRDLHHARSAAGPARNRSLPHLSCPSRPCLDICPTAAFPAPYRLDARRCISYLTIEHKGPIPRELRAAIGNRIFGCDDCLAVCPWNKFAQAGHELKLSARHELQALRLADLARLDDAAFRKMFSKSPIKRTGRNRFVRNVLIAIGNSGDATLAPEAIRLLGDASALVRGAAVWAVSRLLPAERLAALAVDRRAHESEPLVADEWTAALAATAA